MVFHFQGCAILYITLNITKMRSNLKKINCLYLNVNTLNKSELANLHLSLPRAKPRFSQDWLRIHDSFGYPHYDWVDHIGRIHLKSNAKTATCPSVILKLRWVILIVPMRSKLRP